MNKYQFEQAIIKLEVAFKPMSKNSDERDEKIDIYYNRLKFTDEYILNKAITYLQDNYEYRNFPLIADILKAVYRAKESMRKEYHQEEECEYCQGTGWVISDCMDELGKLMSYTQVNSCKFCAAGRAVRRACEIKDAKTGRQRYRVELKKTMSELTDNLPDNIPDDKEGFLSK